MRLAWGIGTITLAVARFMNAQFPAEAPCVLCQKPAVFLPGSSPLLIECERCGRFKITMEFSQDVLSKDLLTLPFLSAGTRQAHERGKALTLTTENYEALANEHRWTSVQEKSRKLLNYVGSKTRFYSEIIVMKPEIDYPLFDAVSPEECHALANTLFQKNLLSHGTGQSPPPDNWCLTMEGWDKLEPLQSGGIPGRCFVAMAFDKELDFAYYDAIKPAISEAGYDPICLKERLPNDDICDVILAEIRKAQFVVADFTKQRGGVYFEAGFAKALGKDVFWTCREDDFGDLHFDTNHYGHVKWSEPADLKEQLRDWIVAELGFGPHRA